MSQYPGVTICRVIGCCFLGVYIYFFFQHFFIFFCYFSLLVCLLSWVQGRGNFLSDIMSIRSMCMPYLFMSTDVSVGA